MRVASQVVVGSYQKPKTIIIKVHCGRHTPIKKP